MTADNTSARNTGYQDGFAGAKAKPPSWETDDVMSSWYFAGYQLGTQARRKIKGHAMVQALELDL